MSKSPDPETWAIRIAVVKDIVASSASIAGGHIRVSDLLDQANNSLLGHADFHEDRGVASEDRALRGELEFIVWSAVQEFVSDGLLVELPGAGGSGRARRISAMAGALGWPNHGWWDLNMPGMLVPTARGLANFQNHEATDQSITRWPEINRLATEASATYRAGHEVAAALAARVTVEIALEFLLRDANSPADSNNTAAKNERLVFENLLNDRKRDLDRETFTPLDASGLRSVVSGIRAWGNDVAHSGLVGQRVVLASNMAQLATALSVLSAIAERLAKRP